MSNVSNPHFNTAAELYRQGKLDDAICELKEAISQEPGLLKAYITLGAIYEGQKRDDKAIDVYRRALQIEMDDPRANYRLGVLLMRLEHYGDALTPLRMAWSNDQKNPHVASALAFALDKSGDYATAQIMYEAALRLDPKMSDIRFNLGTLHFHQKRYEAAITCYVTYMVKVGDNSRAHRNIAKSLLQLGQLDSAIVSFKKAAAMEPASSKNLYSIALVYDMKDELDEAISYYRQALEITPDYPEARYKLAKALKSNNQIAEAITEFQTCLHFSPQHHQALNGLATCFINRREYVEAIGLLKQAVGISPRYAMAHYNLGVAMSNMANYEGALQHFQEAVRLDPLDEAASSAVDQLLAQSISRAI